MTKTEIAKNLLRRTFIKEEYREYYEIDGKYDGEYKSWWNNGQLAVHCYYKNGKLDGECRHWDDDGMALEHYYYKNDIVTKVK